MTKKYVLSLLVVLAVLALPIASAEAVLGPNDFGGSSWASCNTAGNYGGWDKQSPCYVAWNGVSQACEESNRDASFTVGSEGMIVTEMIIEHLDGVAETTDSFEIKDASGNVICSFADVTSGTEEWKTLTCSNLNIPGGTVLTLHPTAASSWSDCATWGQVAIGGICYVEESPQVPEFSLVAASIALLGAGTGFVALRRRK